MFMVENVIEKDFYEELVDIQKSLLIKGKYVIYEKDSVKGYRIIHFDLPSGAIYREDKF